MIGRMGVATLVSQTVIGRWNFEGGAADVNDDVFAAFGEFVL